MLIIRSNPFRETLLANSVFKYSNAIYMNEFFKAVNVIQAVYISMIRRSRSMIYVIL